MTQSNVGIAVNSSGKYVSLPKSENTNPEMAAIDIPVITIVSHFKISSLLKLLDKAIRNMPAAGIKTAVITPLAGLVEHPVEPEKQRGFNIMYAKTGYVPISNTIPNSL